jgi:hypothetical protein
VDRFNQQLSTVKGQIEAATVKLNEYDNLLEQEEDDSLVDITKEDKEERAKRIANLKKQIKHQNEIIVGFVPEIKTQFDSIKQTYDKLIGDDLTLGEKIRTLFREQGITIVAIITAIGMVVSTLVESILLATRSAASAIKPKPPSPKPDPGPSPGPEPGPTPGPTPDPGGVKEWIKQQLKNIAKLLLKLGDKMLVALPGIIGSIVNFVLKSASAAIGFVAEHLWILAVAIGGILYNYVISLQSPNHDRTKNRST